MDAKSHKDNMEKFFQENWDDRKVSQESGVPDLDSLWDDIAKNSQPDQNRRRVIFWWSLPFGLAALFMTGVYLFPEVDSVRVVSTLNLIEREIESTDLTASDDLNNLSDDSGLNISSETGYIISSKTSPASVHVSGVSGDENDFKAAELSKNIIQGNTKNNVLNRESVGSTVQNGSKFLTQRSLMMDEESRTGENKPGSFNLNPIEIISLEPLRVEKSRLLIDLPTTENWIEANRIKKAYSLALSMSKGRHVFFGNTDQKEIESNEVRLEEGQFWKVKMELGYEYAVGSRWLFGLSGKRHKFKSHYELAVNYTGNSEIQDGEGNWHSSYSHSLPTIFGSLPMNHVLIRGENDNLQEGESIPFTLLLNHEVDEIALNIGHQWTYDIGKFEFGIAAEAQLGYWFTSSKIASVNLYSHHEKVWHNRTVYIEGDYELEQPWNIGIGLNLMGLYSFNDYHAIGVTTSLSQTVLGPQLYDNLTWAPSLLEGGLMYRFSF